MCFYFLKRNYGLEPTTIREIFFEKASAQRKDSVETARYECPYSTFGLRGSVAWETVAIGRGTARTRPSIESDK